MRPSKLDAQPAKIAHDGTPTIFSFLTHTVRPILMLFRSLLEEQNTSVVFNDIFLRLFLCRWPRSLSKI